MVRHSRVMISASQFRDETAIPGITRPLLLFLMRTDDGTKQSL